MNPPTYYEDPQRDDQLSIYSAAPSYHSTSTLVPTYTSLPSPRQAQSQNYTSLLSANYNVTSWHSLTGSGHQNRAYANVAARRAQRDEAAKEIEDAARVLSRMRDDDGRRGSGVSEVSVVSTAEEDGAKEAETDADTVLEEEEAKSWDHLASQMEDWNERERKWEEFSRRYTYKEGKRRGWGKILGV
ncbi:uncharacterized protein LAJ45_09373 [Morchella importuna]|uniref:uncharacterized protein n=1 Tax=Morchella importuna TaxID=1174673 RepID=UPI001E8E89BA|nr:uncharacterized protein LAJ45_09373 [Morchella importuna]KAH8146690.1 hypothetical protein LAJ45_09373 [Morchella importuna]